MGSTLGLLKHCEENNLAGVTGCLSRGVDVNTVSEDGHWSGLTIAAAKNYPELLEILVSHPDIKINQTTAWNWRGEQWTALLFACAAGNRTIVSRLVKVPGLDINYQDENGETAAHWAIERGCAECVRILAETGRVDWNKTNKRRGTPLYWALEKGHSDIVDIIDSTASASASPPQGPSASLSAVLDTVRIYKEKEQEESELTDHQKLIRFLAQSIEEKGEAIREKESDLKCPVCLETAGGEIFCCVEQHLVCSQCRPNLRECPQCRQPYPPTPIRHRYAEKMVRELEKLRAEFNRIIGEFDEVAGVK